MQRHVVVPYGAANSSVRTRALEWISRFERRASAPRSDGDIVVHGPGFERRPVPAGSDVLLLRNARRFTRGRGEARLLADARIGVYDLDDGLPWDDGRLPGLGRWRKRPWPRSLLARRAASSADRVIAGNQVIADWAVDHCDDVRIVPTCVEPADYRRRTSWSVDGDVPTIGWIGSPATQGYLLDIAAPLHEVHRRTGARLEVIGGDAESLADPIGFADVVPWVESTALERIAEWDVGIMPLRDGVYERAKCGYKLLQYAAAGVPAVGSPVGVNESLLASMHGGAPTESDEWVDALVDVIEASADRREQMARAGVAVAEAYSYDAWYDRWVDAVGWAGE